MERNNHKARILAFYLPQFHPIPENDEWWGKGFTEWTNTAKAKPLYRGHYQPHIPADLSFYDLRLAETRNAQAELAREHGIEAFCYYHYWFGGKRLLERIFNEVLESGEPDFPFCLCWANHSWTGIWTGCPGRTLIEQTYPGETDHRAHFETLVKAFNDKRYLKVDEKPLFLIYNPMDIPDVHKLCDSWRTLAIKAGLKGLYLVGLAWTKDWVPQKYGFDGATPKDLLPPIRTKFSYRKEPVRKLVELFREMNGRPTVYSYDDYVNATIKENCINSGQYPCIIPNWDNTPRSGQNGLVLHGSKPESFRILIRKALDVVNKFPPEKRIIFIKSWNEWAEGNHLEPDLVYGKRYLKVIKEEIEGANDTLKNTNLTSA